MLTSRLRNQKGVTLVELILVIAVLGIVLAAATSFFLFGTNTFSLGSSQAKVQQEARLAATMLNQDLRTAINVRVYTEADTLPTDPDLFIVSRIGDVAPYSLMYSRPSGDLETDIIFSSLAFFVITASGNKFIRIAATGVEKTRDYTIDITVLLENKGQHPYLSSIVDDTAEWTAVVFTK